MYQVDDKSEPEEEDTIYRTMLELDQYLDKDPGSGPVLVTVNLFQFIDEKGGPVLYKKDPGERPRYRGRELIQWTATRPPTIDAGMDPDKVVSPCGTSDEPRDGGICPYCKDKYTKLEWDEENNTHFEVCEDCGLVCRDDPPSPPPDPLSSRDPDWDRRRAEFDVDLDRPRDPQDYRPDPDNPCSDLIDRFVYLSRDLAKIGLDLRMDTSSEPPLDAKKRRDAMREFFQRYDAPLPGLIDYQKEIDRIKHNITNVFMKRPRISPDRIFIDHIRSHLDPGEKVVCKICGMDVDGILTQWAFDYGSIFSDDPAIPGPSPPPDPCPICHKVDCQLWKEIVPDWSDDFLDKLAAAHGPFDYKDKESLLAPSHCSICGSSDCAIRKSWMESLHKYGHRTAADDYQDLKERHGDKRGDI